MGDLRNAGKPPAPVGPSFVSHHSHNNAVVRGREPTGNIALDGSPKRTTDVMVHPGMMTKSPVTGKLHTHAFDRDYFNFDAGSPLKAGPPAGKRLPPVAISPTMRSRTSPRLSNDQHFALGKIVLDNATKSGGTPADELGIGKSIPDTVSEN